MMFALIGDALAANACQWLPVDDLPLEPLMVYSVGSMRSTSAPSLVHLVRSSATVALECCIGECLRHAVVLAVLH